MVTVSASNHKATVIYWRQSCQKVAPGHAVLLILIHSIKGPLLIAEDSIMLRLYMHHTAK